MSDARLRSRIVKFLRSQRDTCAARLREISQTLDSGVGRDGVLEPIALALAAVDFARETLDIPADEWGWNSNYSPEDLGRMLQEAAGRLTYAATLAHETWPPASSIACPEKRAVPARIDATGGFVLTRRDGDSHVCRIAAITRSGFVVNYGEANYHLPWSDVVAVGSETALLRESACGGLA